jgi:adenine-specific DNA-methyltransferase
VQCIYVDPPYGIKFNSNFQWSTTSRDVKDGNTGHITREPEQVKAFRDTWRDGIHSYLTYLRDRLTVARDLLHESGSIFVQIGDENVHRVRSLLEEVFGEDNFIGLIWFRKKTMPLGATYLERMGDYIVWFGKAAKQTKFRRLYRPIDIAGDFHWNWRQVDETRRRKFSKKGIGVQPSGRPVPARFDVATLV